MNMSIKFRNIDKCKYTKEEIKLHIIEKLIENRFKDYTNDQLSSFMYRCDGKFKEIYNWSIEHIFE